MIKIIFSLVIVSCLLVSCAGDKVFVRAVNSGTTVILPEYKGYLFRDTTLDTASVRIRTQTCTELQRLIDSELVK